MTAIRQDSVHGISAFTSDSACVMTCGSPHVAWGFSCSMLEDWLTTLEEIMPTIEPCHLWAIERLYFSLKAAHKKHQAQHEEIVSEAPNADDLMAYLVAYTSAMTK